MKNSLIIVFFLFIFSGKYFSQNNENINQRAKLDSLSYDQATKFNFKSGIKENGIYIHTNNESDFENENHLNIKKGWYVVTEHFSDLAITEQEVKRYFNFGFPEADFILNKKTGTYFITVHFAESKQLAIQQAIDTKASGVPHVWIQIIE